MSAKDLNQIYDDGNSMLDHVLSEEEIIGMDPNLDNEDSFNQNDNKSQLNIDNSQIIQNLDHFIKI